MEDKPDLVFITTTGPKLQDSRTRTVIRKHVMRDIGKARRIGTRRKWKKAVQYELVLRPPTPDKNSSGVESFALVERGPQYDLSQRISTLRSPDKTLVNFISRFSARGDPFIRYPIEMDRRARALLDHVFNEKFGYLRSYREGWFPVGLSGPAAFHQFLSNLALHARLERSNVLGSEDYEDAEAMLHNASAIKLVNKQIRQRPTICNDTIGAVMGLVCHAHVVGELTGAWTAHMSGLMEIIRLLGGPDALPVKMRLALFWIDITGSCTQDLPPRFPPPIQLISLALPFPSNLPVSSGAARISATWRSLFPSRDIIINIFDDLCKFSALTQLEAIRTNDQVFAGVEFSGSFLNPLIYRLLMIRSDVLSETASLLQEALRLASILYLAEIRRAFNVYPIVSMIHVVKLRRVLERCEYDWGELELLRIWVLALGAMEADAGVDLSWFGTQLQRAFRLQGVTSIKGEIAWLKNVLWIDQMHEERYKSYRLFDGTVCLRPDLSPACLRPKIDVVMTGVGPDASWFSPAQTR